MPYVYEGIRNSAIEKNIIDDSTGYTLDTTSSTFTTMATYTFTLASACDLLLRIRGNYNTSAWTSGSVYYNCRLYENDSVPLLHGGQVVHSSVTTSQFESSSIVHFASGSHTVYLQGGANKTATATGSCNVTSVQMGIFDPTDKNVDYAEDNVGTSVGASSTTTNWLVADVSAPTTNRQTVLGQMKSDKYTVFVVFSGWANSNTVSTICSNTGESPTQNIHFKVYKDGTQVDWSDRLNVGYAYLAGSTAIYSYYASAGDSDTIKVEAYNNTGGSLTLYGVLHVILCPWIVHSMTASFPVTFSSTLGTTYHITLEPLTCFDYLFFTATSRALKVGNVRGVDTGICWGQSLTGTSGSRCDAVLTFSGSYPDDNIAQATGKFCIISYIGADIS